MLGCWLWFAVSNFTMVEKLFSLGVHLPPMQHCAQHCCRRCCWLWLWLCFTAVKVLWLPPITAHCFRPQWATPDQPVLWRANAVQSAMSNVHSANSNAQCAQCNMRCDIQSEKCIAFWRANAVQSDNVHSKCSGRSFGKCRKAVNCNVLWSACLHCTHTGCTEWRSARL